MSKKAFSILSALLFILTVFPIIAGPTRWGNGLFVFVLDISIYLPLILGGAGLVFGLLGRKGNVKVSLVLLNIIGSFHSLYYLLQCMVFNSHKKSYSSWERLFNKGSCFFCLPSRIIKEDQ
ncbi:hypothetical protein [Halobacillus amylolyticus]|uniref:Uncharacterized protein n=1 Tax=Halobacillus amylolyticus TaxID=2932259 RepID=A0ABY4HG04_9BACI|nr:hypothetical protein [Halobacillus amylolyticus]UOR12810.1 hypothetical protein MUO15_04655 [Halobacillus amylolyticus]